MQLVKVAVRRLGVWNAVLIVGGNGVLLATTTFLASLWFAGDVSDGLRNGILLNGWLIRSVTISSLVIRATVGAQLLGCVSMLASIALEHGHVRLRSAAAISMMRFQNGGAFGFLQEMMISWPPKDHRSASSRLVVLATAVLAVVATALQFTSTALLSDVGPGVVSPLTPETRPIGYALSPDKSIRIEGSSESSQPSRNYIHSNPIFPTFAEYAEPPAPADDDVVEGVSDTGRSFRAFLPILSAAGRTHLREYAGPATVFDTRVVCLRPDQDEVADDDPRSRTNVSFSHSWGSMPMISGDLSSSLRAQRMVGPAGTFLSCIYSVPTSRFGTAGGDWPLTLCNPYQFDPSEAFSGDGPRFGWTTSEMEPLPQGFVLPGRNTSISTTSGFGMAATFVVINTTGTVEEWSRFTDADASGDKIQLVPDRADGEWLHFRPADGADNSATPLGFSITICYSALDSMNAVVHATNIASAPFAEPEATWNATLARYDTRQARQQLAGTSGPPLTPEQRGVFQVAPLDTWQGYDETGASTRTDVEPSTVRVPKALDNNLQNDISLCASCLCEFNCPVFLNDVQAAVAGQVMADTGSAARGLQALLTMQAAQVYYDQAGLFDLSAATTTRAIVEVVLPRGSTFFWVVALLLMVHVVGVGGVVVAFLRTTEHSVVGDAWLVAGQLRGDEEVEGWYLGGGKDVEEDDVEGRGKVAEDGFKGKRRGDWLFVRLVRDEADGVAKMKKCD